MQEHERPKLTIDGQINHLKSKGTKFCAKYAEDDARQYLLDNNNYFRLRAYRKNFTKIQFGKDSGMYQNLDFAHLVDLAIIDTRLRNVIIEMCLNIEHFSKVKLIKLITDSDENGYSIVTDYLTSRRQNQSDSSTNVERIRDEIQRNCNSVYCGDLVNKYNKQGYPIWVFIEVIPFGIFIDFFLFCALKHKCNQMQREYSMLMEVKSLRNAAAHNNCILNDLCQKDTTQRTQYQVSAELGKISGISKQTRDTKMSNPRIRQIATLLYAHKTIVSSLGMHNHICKRLNEVCKRLFRDDNYSCNLTVQSSFVFIQQLVDSWYSVEV